MTTAAAAKTINIHIVFDADDGVFRATSPELRGLIVESESEEDIYPLSRTLAISLMQDMNMPANGFEIEYVLKQ